MKGNKNITIEHPINWEVSLVVLKALFQTKSPYEMPLMPKFKNLTRAKKAIIPNCATPPFLYSFLKNIHILRKHGPSVFSPGPGCLKFRSGSDHPPGDRLIKNFSHFFTEGTARHWFYNGEETHLSGVLFVFVIVLVYVKTHTLWHPLMTLKEWSTPTIIIIHECSLEIEIENT